MSTERFNHRVIIENVYPELDCGRYAVKRCVGDIVNVYADIFMDGHDLIKAVICYREPKTDTWTETPLKSTGNDRWHGSFPLNTVGFSVFTIKAWPDRFGTWQSNTRKSEAARQTINLELQEGQLLIEQLITSIPASKKSSELFKAAFAALKGGPQSLKNFLLSADALDFYDFYDPRQGLETYRHHLRVWADRKLAEFSAWYELFPRSQGSDPAKSGTFQDCERRLPDIKDMGFNVIYLPPIHPIGLKHRKGKNNALIATDLDPGSPYAIGSELGGHKSIHPELGTLEDFRHFVEAARRLDIEIALDFAVQVSRDHPYIEEHPEWFLFRPNGTIRYAENPPKKYQDIANVHFESGDSLWNELRSIVQFWIDQGVTIFRVDNPHTKPFAFWEWLIASLQEKHPNVLFLAEAFTRPKIMYALAKAGFTQSYSYFTWRNTKQELTEYLTELTTGWPKDYFRPNFFPTTPDIFPTYLHDSGKPGFIVRLALAATLSSNYGIYSGYELCEGASLDGKEEYADSEKYELKVRDWNAPGNIKSLVRKINSIRVANPALQTFANLKFYPSSNEQILFYGKMTADKTNAVFIAVNLDPANVQQAHIELPLHDLGVEYNRAYELEDLLLGHTWKWTGGHQHLLLDPNKNPVSLFRIRSS